SAGLTTATEEGDEPQQRERQQQGRGALAAIGLELPFTAGAGTRAVLAPVAGRRLPVVPGILTGVPVVRVRLGAAGAHLQRELIGGAAAVCSLRGGPDAVGPRLGVGVGHARALEDRAVAQVPDDPGVLEVGLGDEGRAQ